VAFDWRGKGATLKSRSLKSVELPLFATRKIGDLVVVGVNSRSLSLTNGCGEQTAHNVRKSLEEEELLVRSAKPLPVNEQQKTLNAKLRGHYQYYGRRTNYRAIRQFYQRVRCIWREWLSRRTRGKPLRWERFAAILRQYPLLLPRITQAWAGAGSYA
jgi:Group II intron, maturase-specific domain